MKGEYFRATCDICGGPGVAQVLNWFGPNIHENALVCFHYLEKQNEPQERKPEARQVDQAEDGIAVAYLHASRSLC